MNTLYEAPLTSKQRIINLAIWGIALVAIIVLIVSLGNQDFWAAERWTILANPDLLTLLVEGALKTIWVAIVSLIFSLLAAVIIARAAFSRHRWVRYATVTYVEVFRGLPLLLLIFFLYLGLPAVGLPISTFWALCIGIALFTSANLAEIIRGGIDSLGIGQREAAESLGISETAVFTRILLPQAARNMLPAGIAQLVILVKETSLGFIIGYTELLRNGRSAVEFLGSDYAPAIYVLVAVIFIIINFSLTMLSHRIARRKKPRRAGVSDLVPPPGLDRATRKENSVELSHE